LYVEIGQVHQGMWDVGFGMWDVGCGMWDVGCGMLGVLSLKSLKSSCFVPRSDGSRGFKFQVSGFRFQVLKSLTGLRI
jgi:hypothetical protein